MQYKVQSEGEDLSTIAERFNLDLWRLVSANHQIRDPHSKLPAGQSICVPSWATYVAQEGETLKSIAQRFGAVEDTLAAANPDVRDPNIPLANQLLAVPFLGVYTVEAGDTLSGIGAKYRIAWDSILEANCDGLQDPDHVFPGQLLAVPRKQDG